MSYILDYAEQIDTTYTNNNKILVNDYVKKMYDVIAENIVNPKQYHLNEELAKRHINFIQKFCRTSDGVFGAPLVLEPFQLAFLEATFGMVDDNDIRQYKEVNFICGRKNGKALSLDTWIPTPKGFKPMEKIQIGDEVFGDDGKAYHVTAISPVFENHDCYRVTFEDGAEIIADAEHIWHVKTKHGMRDKTTKEMLNCSHVRNDGKGMEYRYRVPMNNPVEYSEKKLPIDPYTLGVWLGDGSSSDTRITVSYDDLEETKSNLESYGHTVKVYDNKDRAPSLGLDIAKKGYHNKTRDKLRELNVINNKHIPLIYMKSSIEQRMELLRGLMDTDGYCSKKGQCEFCQKDERLTDQVRELLSSLGVKSSKRIKTIHCNGKDCIAYSVLFFMTKNNSCFKLQRKHERLKDTLHKRMNWKSIVSIEPVDSVPCKCIAIDNPSKLYCAGKSYTVTHNTTLLSSVALDLLCNDREGSPKIYFIATKIDQAKIGFEECCNMREQSPLLSKHTRKRAFDIYFPKNFGSIKPIASDVKKLDGLNPHAVIIDELGAITKRTVYDDMKQSMYARRQPLLFCISTNNWVRQGVYDAQVTYGKKMLDGKLEDNRFLFLYYALNDKSQIKDEKYWVIANPGIGVIKNTDELRASVNKAKHDPQYLPTLCVKDFNLDENPTTAWLTNDAAVNTEEVSLEYLENSYAVGGCDLSSTYDLTCASVLIKKPDDKKTYVLQHYFLPQKRIDEIREQEEPEAPYELWAEQGYLTISPGAQVSFHQVTEWFVKMVEEHDIRPLWIGYDRALAGYWVEDMESYGFEMEKIAQGAKTWTYPMKQLKAELMDHTLVYQNNPMTYWCLINTGVDSQNEDGIESQRPIKIQKHRRIDGTVSMLNAYTAYLENQAEYEGYIK